MVMAVLPQAQRARRGMHKKPGKIINDIHTFCAQITDGVIKYSMEKDSVDNVSVIFIAFKNFENKMKEPNFVYEMLMQRVTQLIPRF